MRHTSVLELKCGFESLFAAHFQNFTIFWGGSFADTALCYQHDKDVSLTMEVKCTHEVVAQYFRIVLKEQRQVLALCELQIYGGTCR